LGEDLQSGNLTAAPYDFTTLSQKLSGAKQKSAPTANSATGKNALAQAFAQLGRALQSGTLQGAQQNLTNLQQDLQQISSQEVRDHHHRHQHRAESSQSLSSQQTHLVAQAFSTLAQDLQAGNLSGAQSAFSALQNDLQRIGGFLTVGLDGIGSARAPPSSGSPNLTA
jgi:hypothetical protein